MVGVPGKSKACLDCRKRRRPCDRQRPACGQCIRGGIECSGYEKGWVFLNSTIQHGTGTNSSSTLKRESYSINPQSPQDPQTPTERKEVAKGWTGPHARGKNDAPVILSQSMTRSAYEHVFLDTFWSAYLPRGRATALYNTGDWMNVVHDLYNKNGCLRMVLLANSVALHGLESNDQYMLEKGQHMYGQALRAVALALQHPVASRSDAVLSAVRMLLLFEVCYSNPRESNEAQSQRWHTHGAGHMAMIFARGPQCFKRGASHKLFADGRLHQGIVDALLRRPSFLNEPQWKSIPFTEVKKTPKDALVDIIVEMGGLFAMLDEAGASHDQKERVNKLGAATAKAWAVDKDLVTWTVGQGKPVIDFMESKLGAPPAEPPSYQELSMVDLAMNYLSLCVSIYGVLEALTAQIPESQLPKRIQARQYCRKIGLLIPFFQASKPSVWTVHVLSLPLGVAMRYLRQQKETEELLETQALLLQALQGKAGFAIARFLQGLEQREIG